MHRGCMYCKCTEENSIVENTCTVCVQEKIFTVGDTRTVYIQEKIELQRKHVLYMHRKKYLLQRVHVLFRYRNKYLLQRVHVPNMYTGRISTVEGTCTEHVYRKNIYCRGYMYCIVLYMFRKNIEGKCTVYVQENYLL